MFLLQFLKPNNFVNLLNMLYSCKDKMSLLAVGFLSHSRVVRFNFHEQELTFHLRTKGDIAIIFEMFFLKVYPFDLVSQGGCTIGLDLGAHIGIPAIIFAKTTSIEKIFSLEPVKENFQTLVENIKLNNLEEVIIPINSGIGAKDEDLFINKSSSTNSHSLVLEEGEGKKESVNVISFKSLMGKFNISKFDLIKMDIEGYEYTIMHDLLSIINDSKILMMERHDIVGNSFDLEIYQKVINKGFNLECVKNPGPVYTFSKR